MSLPDWVLAVTASVVGGIIVAAVGWALGLKNLISRIDSLEDEVEELDDVVWAFLEAMPEEVTVKVLKETWREARSIALGVRLPAGIRRNGWRLRVLPGTPFDSPSERGREMGLVMVPIERIPIRRRGLGRCRGWRGGGAVAMRVRGRWRRRR